MGVLSNYPPLLICRHSSQSAQAVPRSARKKIVENPELMSAGERLMRREISEFQQSSSENSSSSHQQAPLSPSTHMLVVAKDSDSAAAQHQRETFV